MADSSFDSAIKFTLSWEGGYVNDPHDPGGETKYGISKRAYPNLNIKDLSLEEAKIIYRNDYWNKIQGDVLPEKLAIAAFDFAVNSGVGAAKKILQELAGVPVDGKIGPETLVAIQRKADDLGELTLAVKLIERRLRLYTNIVMKNNTQLKFFPGWINRLFALLYFIF